MKFCDGLISTIIDHMPAFQRGDEERRVTKWMFAKDAIASKFAEQGPTGLGLDKERATKN